TLDDKYLRHPCDCCPCPGERKPGSTETVSTVLLLKWALGWQMYVHRGRKGFEELRMFQRVSFGRPQSSPLNEQLWFRRDLHWPAQGVLSLPGKIDRFTQDTYGFARSVKARGILRFDKVEIKLRPSLKIPGRRKLRIGPAPGSRRLQVIDEVDQRVH